VAVPGVCCRMTCRRGGSCISTFASGARMAAGR
jgi:hypothetical protein